MGLILSIPIYFIFIFSKKVRFLLQKINKSISYHKILCGLSVSNGDVAGTNILKFNLGMNRACICPSNVSQVITIILLIFN